MFTKKTIRRATLIVLSIGLLWGTDSSWKLSIEPTPATWAKSDPKKELTVKLSNVTEQYAWVWASNPLNDYSLTLTDARGATVPMTPRGKQAQQNERTTLHANHAADIPPGGAYTVNLNLADYYDLQPGKFIVHLQLLSQNSDMYPEGTDRFEATPELRKPEKEFTRPSVSVPIVVTKGGSGDDTSP